MYYYLKSSKKILPLFAFMIQGAFAAPATSTTGGCDAWNQVKPKIDVLKRVVGCDPQFTTIECKENSGYGSKIATVGALAGGVAAANIKKTIPKVCGLNIGSYWWMNLFTSTAVAAPTCASEIKAASIRIANNLRTSLEVKNLVMANELTDRVKKERPDLDKMSEEVIRAFTQGPGMDYDFIKKSDELNAKLKPLGISFKNFYTCVPHTPQSKEICDKVLALSERHKYYNQKENMAMNARILSKYFQDDYEVRKYQEDYDLHRKLIKQAEDGKIIDASGLAKYYEDAARLASGSVHRDLAITGNYIATILPDAGKIGVLNQADNLAKNSGVYLAKHSAYLKKILPIGLLTGLLAAAGGASAEEITNETASGTLPLIVTESVNSGGCDELDSKYFPRHLENGKCVTPAGVTDLAKDFLALSDDEQIKEVCRHRYLEQSITKLADSFFPAGMSLNCSEKTATVSTPMGVEKSFYGKFVYSDAGDLNSVSISASGLKDGVSAYNLDFKDGSVSAGTVRNGRSYNAIKPGFSSAMTSTVGQDFAGRQIISLASQGCCFDGKQEACMHFSRVSNGRSGSSSLNTSTRGSSGNKGVQ